MVRAGIASVASVPEGIAVTNGTAALEVTLAALGVGPGDEVIVPSFTFVATVNSILAVGAKPVLVDCDPYTFNTTTDLMKEKLETKDAQIEALTKQLEAKDETVEKLAKAAQIQKEAQEKAEILAKASWFGNLPDNTALGEKLFEILIFYTFAILTGIHLSVS